MVEILFESIIKEDKVSNLSITFPFKILITHSGAEKDRNYQKFINVSVTTTQLARWNYNHNDVDKILFEFAMREIKSKSLEELINEKLEITLTSDNQSEDQPFDPTKIPNPEGFTLSLDDDKLHTKPKMGF